MHPTPESLWRDGKIVEAGWVSLQETMPPSSLEWRNDMRTAFFAGAQHIFQSMVNAASHPGDNELQLAAIDCELREFINDHMLRYMPVEGSA